MSTGTAIAPGTPAGTRPGRLPGVLLVLCQCCKSPRAQIMAEASDGKLCIKWRRHGERHYVLLGLDLCDRMEGVGKIWCACCDPQTEHGRILAECQDEYLIIRSHRHGRLHFVVLERTRLHMLLAPETQTA